MAEQAQFYEKVDSISDTRTLKQLYGLFGMKVEEKKKKTRFVEQLWSADTATDDSVEASLLLFPELAKGTNITLSSGSSKKAKKRFAPAVSLIPLPPSECLEYKLQNVIGSNILAVATAGLSAVPDLTIKMLSEDEDDRMETNHPSRQARAIMDTKGITSWSECRLALMIEYYHQDAESVKLRKQRRDKKHKTDGNAMTTKAQTEGQSVFPDIPSMNTSTSSKSIFPDIIDPSSGGSSTQFPNLL